MPEENDEEENDEDVDARYRNPPSYRGIEPSPGIE
jgi:hypothetical protein